MEKQQGIASKEAYKEHLLKEIANNTGANFHDLRQSSNAEAQTGRAETMLKPLGVDQGVNTSQPTRTSTGTETYDNPRKSQGAQTDREHYIGDDDDELMPVYTNVVHNSAATADYSGEVERQQSLVEHMQRENQRRAEEQLNNTRIEVQGLLQEQERQHREEAKAAIEAALNQQRQTGA